MSQFRFRAPVQHIPGFRELEIDAQPLLVKLQKAGIKVPVGLLDNRYYFTDLEGWGKVLSDLTFKSNLYAKEKWDCDNYALKAMTVCAERYGLNTLGMVIGDIPTGRHAFNLFYYGEGFMLHEPNAGFEYGGMFGLGENGYRADMLIM